MRAFCRSMTIGAAIVTGLALSGCAGSPQLSRFGTVGTQIAALPPDGTVSDVVAPPLASPLPGQPSGTGPRANSANRVNASRFEVWAGYDADVALHPYTSNVGPCPEGSLGTGCGQAAGSVIKPSHYEQGPFAD